jgi:flagellar basal-body rod modification protein FlgD
MGMMGVKGGTQTWSTAKQQVDFKSDGAQTVSAVDKEKYLGDEEIGDTLNKISDPNYTAASKKPRAVGNAELGKDAFMTLLLTQMKNQDPTNPLKSHEMAAQLAQFTSLEKLNNINESIAALRKDNQPDHNFQALSMIGKVVTMDNSKIPHTEPNEQHDLRFSLPQDASKCNIEVKDATGATVRKIEIKNVKAGAQQMMWNGKTDEGGSAPPGDYTLAVEAFGSNGKKLYVQTKAEGQITGVNFTAHGAVLLMGKQQINLSDVKSITDPNVQQPMPMGAGPMSGAPGAARPAGASAIDLSGASAGGHPVEVPPELLAAMNGQGAAGGKPALPPQLMQQLGLTANPPGVTGENLPTAQSPKKVEIKPETKPNAAKRASLGKGSIADAGMSSGLINNLNKEGAKAGGYSGT